MDVKKPPDQAATAKKRYAKPRLVRYGDARSLTQAQTTLSSESSMGGGPMKPSERRFKQDIERVGTHPFGFGLFLFRYKPELRAAWGEGWQLGVMAEEVEALNPGAVSLGPDGVKRVDYGLLGIGQPPR